VAATAMVRRLYRTGGGWYGLAAGQRDDSDSSRNPLTPHAVLRRCLRAVVAASRVTAAETLMTNHRPAR
jgi:hypothetical protein